MGAVWCAGRPESNGEEGEVDPEQQSAPALELQAAQQEETMHPEFVAAGYLDEGFRHLVLLFRSTSALGLTLWL